MPWLPFLLLVPLVNAAKPVIDFDRMGKVGLAGAFAGFDFLTEAPQSFDPATCTLFARQESGGLSPVGATNAQGRISAGCSIGDTFYFGGSFSSVAGVSVNNVAAYSSSSRSISPLGTNGPNGEVLALYCDTKENKVWVGGRFTSPGSAVAIWDTKASSWSKPPFSGVRGAGAQVSSITTNSSQSSLFFAGSFLAAFGTPGAINGNNPNVPFSPGATPYSSSLVPVPLSNVEVEGSPSTSQSGFSNIKAILCPAGDDGPGNSWFARDGDTAVITIRTFTRLDAAGVRLGNTFLGDHATTGFSVTTIPDNTVQTLHYVDPTTGQNQTCRDPCPLLTDSNILYQDFLFDTGIPITGVQIRLSQWNGQAPGLHIVQLLSTGAFASAIAGRNGPSCFAPQSSMATHTGTWNSKVANTEIAGTIQEVLVSTVNVGTPPAQGPSFTWMPYVSASGNYQVNLLVPGCASFQDCPLRTSVKVTVFPGNGLPPSVTEVSQRNENAVVTPIYTGPIVPTSPDFVTTITLTLSDSPEGQGQNGRYELVADRIQLVLLSSNTTQGSSNNGPISGAGSQLSFGFLEWPRSSRETVDATSSLPNATLTSADRAGIQLFKDLGGLTSSNTSITAVAHHSSGTIVLAGSFSLTSGAASGSNNIVAFRNDALVALSDNGLDGAVSSLVLVGDQLFVGGAFRDTSSASQQGKLRGVAIYNVATNTWSSLQYGVDGVVSSLNYVDGKVQVAGNFSRTLSSETIGAPAGGLASWKVDTGAWVGSGGFVVGNMNMIANATDSTQFVAGSVVASREFGATGMVLLKNGEDEGESVVEPLVPQLDVPTASGGSSRAKRSHSLHGHQSWASHMKLPRLFSRQAPATPSASSLPLLAAPAPAVLAGAFWTNSSSSTEVAILGGNFTSAGSQGVAIYDSNTEVLTTLEGTKVNGVVRSLLVHNDKLYIGGQFTVEGTDANGFAIYNLASRQWDNTGLQALQPASGSTVLVRSITRSNADADSIIVAGQFNQAGGLRCPSICKLNINSKQWNTLGEGIQGEVASVAYAGKNQELLIAAGAITLSTSARANVAQFSITNNTWAAVGDGSQLPGGVTAVEVNNRNSSSIFAAGRSSDGSAPFLYFWNGVSWTSKGSSLEGNTTISQLAMVPLQNTHDGQGIIEKDRVLMISGSLADSSFGTASSALYDGQSFLPYIATTTRDGSLGSIAALFHSFSTFSFNQRRFLATGIVILISIAIAAGVVFLLALIGIVWTLLSRRDEKVGTASDVDDDDDSTHHRPSSLLEHINAATRSTILGNSVSPYSNYNADKEEEKIQDHSYPPQEQDPFVADTFQRAETPSDAFGHLLADEGTRVVHARYSFDAPGEGELPISAGAEVEILDDKDHAWWYARDPRTGREGVIPAAYVY